ncbi:GDSL-type esterase/lipase family protein [Demequina sp. NBRC 110053]|uniref:GDSL-type esterase/lipase family protein n=1 Tax=Demequina sp. NBRC 110053 TaxID=1570342 RepID=UPI000A046965|nr:GDSL-type esterase/lipase family protein [Demequina sp. NBRC 110053]
MRNVFFVGDELVAGHGDPKALGWAGRVVARTLPVGPDLRFHTLAVPGETTGELASRWDDEALRRRGAEDDGSGPDYVLFAIGRHDVSRGVSPTMTRLHLANTLDRASALGMNAMVVGPPPIAVEDRRALAEYAALCEEAAARRDVPYVDMYGPLVRHDQWATDMDTGGGALPLQAGYGLMAWLVLHSQWHSWLGLPEQD